MSRTVRSMSAAGLVVLTTIAIAACDSGIQAPAEDSWQPDFLPVSGTVNDLTGDPQASTSAVFPSTNEDNFNMSPTKWAHVLFVDVAVEQVKLEFVSERTFASCFEYRIDDGPPTGDDNFNPAVDDLWEFTCQNNNSTEIWFSATEHVDVRLAFGAEGDERFDWTRFYVLSLENKDQCKHGEWEALGFKNQGQCVRYVETGKDSRNGG